MDLNGGKVMLPTCEDHKNIGEKGENKAKHYT